MQLVDCNIRLDQTDIARDRHATGKGQERIHLLRLAEGVGGKVCQHRHVMAAIDQTFEDGDGIVIGVGDHLVPMFAEGADMLFPVRMVFQQQGFGIRPFATAILLQIPVMGADILEEPGAFGIVRDQAAIGDMRIVMNENLADIENNMIDLAHETFLLLEDCCVFSAFAANANGIA